jgi:putative sugar O-methyltransferase
VRCGESLRIKIAHSSGKIELTVALHSQVAAELTRLEDGLAFQNLGKAAALGRAKLRHATKILLVHLLSPGPIRHRISQWPGLTKPFSMVNREYHRFIHDLSGFEFPNRFACREDVPDNNQQEIVSRLIDYYWRMKSSPEMSRALLDIWAEISKKHAAFSTALERRDVDTVSHFLLNVCNTPLAIGFENSILNSKAHQHFLELNVVDKFLALAESLGCLPVQCPEQGKWGYQSIDVDNLYEQIQARIPFDLTAPAAGGGSYGLRTKGGIFTERNLQAVSTALRVHRLLESAPRKVVAEIGGGIGALTYYLAKAGMDATYLFDLPIVSILQGYFLMKSHGPEQVCLWGEKAHQARINVCPWWALETSPDKLFTLVVNQDSMPEIDQNISFNYLNLIKKKATDYFLSINQEGHAPSIKSGTQSVVYMLVDAVGGFRRLSRERDWMREGYVAETYQIAPLQASHESVSVR